MVWNGIEGEGVELTGSMSIKRVPEGFNGPFGTLWAYSLTFGVVLDLAGRPHDTQAILNYN